MLHYHVLLRYKAHFLRHSTLFFVTQPLSCIIITIVLLTWAHDTSVFNLAHTHMLTLVCLVLRSSQHSGCTSGTQLCSTHIECSVVSNPQPASALA